MLRVIWKALYLLGCTAQCSITIGCFLMTCEKVTPMNLKVYSRKLHQTKYGLNNQLGGNIWKVQTLHAVNSLFFILHIAVAGKEISQ